MVSTGSSNAALQCETGYHFSGGSRGVSGTTFVTYPSYPAYGIDPSTLTEESDPYFTPYSPYSFAGWLYDLVGAALSVPLFWNRALAEGRRGPRVAHLRA